MFKKVIINTTSQIIGKVVSASSTLIITFLIGRSLGAAGYGDFTKIFVFVGYFYTLCDFGLNTIFIKLENKNENFFRALVGLRILIAAIFFSFAIAIAFAFPYNPQTGIGFSPLVKIGILIASFTILTQTMLTTANAIFQKNLRYELSAIAVTSGTIIVLITTLLATITKPSLLIFVWAYVFGGIIFVVVAYFLIFAKFKQLIHPEFNITKFKRLLTLSWPVGLALIFNLIYFRIDILILSAHRSSQEVGVYGLAYQFFEASLAIPIFFANSLYPLLSNLYVNNLKEYSKQIKLWLFFLTTISFVLALALIFISFFVVQFFGQSFIGTPLSLRILATGLPFFFISAILWHLLIIHDKQKYLFQIYAAGAVFNFLTNIIYIPVYGYIAASVITVVSEALVTAMLFLALKFTKD